MVMATKPVLKRKSFAKKPASESELDVALEYAKRNVTELRFTKGAKKGQVKRRAYTGQTLERDLLRVIANSALERWSEQPTTKLVLVAANVAREAIPMYQGRNTRETEQRYEGYKRATMKLMNLRRVWQMFRDAQRRRAGEPIPERAKQKNYPLEDGKKNKGQYRMFS